MDDLWRIAYDRWLRDDEAFPRGDDSRPVPFRAAEDGGGTVRGRYLRLKEVADAAADLAARPELAHVPIGHLHDRLRAQFPQVPPEWVSRILSDVLMSRLR